MTPDEITLTIPRDRALYSVAHLVLSGLGIRLNLKIEHLEDLELAVDAVLERSREEEENVTIAVTVSDGQLETLIGPMRDGVRAEDALPDPAQLEPADGGAHHTASAARRTASRIFS